MTVKAPLVTPVRSASRLYLSLLAWLFTLFNAARIVANLRTICMCAATLALILVYRA
jgi:hypothetical protein